MSDSARGGLLRDLPQELEWALRERQYHEGRLAHLTWYIPVAERQLADYYEQRDNAIERISILVERIPQLYEKYGIKGDNAT